MLYVAANIFKRTPFRWLVSAALCIATAGCADSNPLVEMLGGSHSLEANLQVSTFSPPKNPTNSAAAVSVSITGGQEFVAYKAVVVTGALDCANANFSGAVEKTLPGAETFPISAEDTYQVCALGKKITGDWMQTAQFVASEKLVVDRTPPTATLTSTQGAYINSNLVVMLTTSEPIQTPSSTSFTLNNCTFVSALLTGLNTYTVTFAPTSQGSVSVSLAASGISDLAGNVIASAGSTVTTTYDTVPPILNMLTLASGADFTNILRPSVTLTIANPADEMYITPVSGCASGGTWVPYSATFTLPYNLAANSLNTVYVKVRDAALNESACVGDTVTHDSILPSGFLSDAKPYYVNGPFNMTLTLIEPAISPLTSASFNKNNANVSVLSLSSDGTTYVLTVTPAASGVVSIELNPGALMDRAGNTNSGTITKSHWGDLIAPSPPIGISLGSVPNVLSESPVVNFTDATDSGGSGVDHYEARIVGATLTTAFVRINTGVAISGLSLDENTDYTMEIKTVDVAGNESSVATKTWRTYQRPYSLGGWTASPNNDVYAIQSLGTSEIMIAGAFTGFGGASNFKPYAVGLTTAGTVSPFDTGTGFDGPVSASVTDGTGGVYVGGDFRKYQGFIAGRIAHIHSDGSRDGTFSGAGGFDDPVLALAVDSNSKILVGGHFTDYRGQSAMRIARLLPSGDIDSTFATGNGFNGPVRSIAVQSDGKILVGGQFTDFDSHPVKNIARLKGDGTFDNTFAQGAGFNDDVDAIRIQTNGDILVGGHFTDYNDVTVGHLVRLSIGGTREGTLTTNIVTSPTGPVTSIALDGLGNIYIGGDFTLVSAQPRNNLARLLPTGALDTNFSVGSGFNGDVTSVAVLADSSVLVGGNFSMYNGGSAPKLALLDSFGGRASSFDIGKGFTGPITTLSLLSGSTFFAGGDFTSFGGTGFPYIAKLTVPGFTPIGGFPTGGFTPNGPVRTLTPVTGSQIVLSGNFTKYGVQTANRVCRINNDGSLDNSFNVGSGPNGEVFAVAVAADSDILIAGGFTYALAKLQSSDGNPNTNFNIGAGFDKRVNDIAVDQTTGRIIAVGDFGFFNNVAAHHIVRIYDVDGTPGARDNSFMIGEGFDGEATAVAVQSDGAVIVSGRFSNYDAFPAPKIIRINFNGSPDMDFYYALGAAGLDGIATQIKVLPTGKILLVGEFSTVGDVARPKVALLNPDGSVDTSFSLDTAFNNNAIIHSVKILANGTVLVGGKYFNYLGQPTLNFSILTPP